MLPKPRRVRSCGVASACLVPGSLPILSKVCVRGGRHGALTTSQFFPVAWSGDNFGILASLHLLCTWKLVLLLFVGFFSEIPFKVCHLIHGTSVSLVLLFSFAEIFSPQVNLNHCSKVRSVVSYQDLTRTHLPGSLPILPKGCLRWGRQEGRQLLQLCLHTRLLDVFCC